MKNGTGGGGNKSRSSGASKSRVSNGKSGDKRKKRVADFEVNLGSLHMNTLKRYKKFYKLTDETSNKNELTEVVINHFRQQEIDERETIILFSHMVKHSANKFDTKS